MSFLLPVLLLVLQSPDDRAKSVLSRTTFPKAEELKSWTDREPALKNVFEIVLKRETWLSAVKFIEEHVGPFGDDWKIATALGEWEGSHPAMSDRKGKQAKVRFNMRRLADYERKMIDYRRQQEELKKKGKRIVWKVPPLKYDRLVVHELVHVVQGEYASPAWFHEGLASWAGADPNYVMSFLYNNETLKGVEHPLEGDDLYGRSQIFMMWLEKKSGREIFRKLSKATIFEGAEVKPAFEKLLGASWEKIAEEELAWATQYGLKNRPKKD